MSLLFKNKLSTSFAYNKVKAVSDFGVDALVRDHSPEAASQASNHASTTARQTRQLIDRAEPCFITKRASYTLVRAHWVNPVRKNPKLTKEIEEFLIHLGIVGSMFTLNGTSNLTNLDPMLHVSLDKYGFFAVTASLTTLQAIIAVVEEKNRIWQEHFDDNLPYIRPFALQHPPLSDAQYELVVLHPEHFLPKGSSHTFYTHVNNVLDGKEYVVGHDRTLRQSPGSMGCPRLPAFTFDAVRDTTLPLNVFLVVLNAEIKFRRYRRMGAMPKLPDEVEELMDKTIELVKLIYWKPEVRGPYAERVALSAGMDDDEEDLTDAEMGMEQSDDEDDQDTPGKSASGRRTQVLRCPDEHATLVRRGDHMQYLLSGRHFDLDSDDEELLEELGYGPDVPAIEPK